LVASILAKKSDKTPQKSTPKSVKNQKMAAKVQLMKLKMKADGLKSIPTKERIHFGIKSRNLAMQQSRNLSMAKKSSQENLKAIFVSQTWPFGKVIDFLADSIGLENKNNVANAAKLRLFKHSDGLIVTQDLSEKLDKLIQNEEIFNGDTLILDYIDDENITQVDKSLY
jgi:hypothetical protein